MPKGEEDLLHSRLVAILGSLRKPARPGDRSITNKTGSGNREVRSVERTFV